MKAIFAIFLSFSVIFLSCFAVSCIYGTLFPIKYKEEVFASSEKYDLDPAVVFSMINIESHFRENAVSPKGAVGLMQVMPSTAEGIKTAVGKNEYDLFWAEDNIEFGSFYLSQLYKRFDNLQVALCAYNAGPTTVSGWLKDERYSEDGKSLKEIPFEETKNYLKRFEKNFKYYSSKIK